MAKMVATGVWSWADGLGEAGDDRHSMKIFLFGLRIS